MRAALVGTFLLVAVTCASRAQLPSPPTLNENWLDRNYPKVFWTPSNHFTFGVYYEQFRPPGFDDWDDPPPYRAKFSVDAQVSTEGSWEVNLDSRFPSMVPGWRFVGQFSIRRRARESYFGIGNDSEFDTDNVTDSQPFFYRSDNRRLFLRGEAQRQIVGGLRALAGLHLERWKIDTLAGVSQLAIDAARGVDTTIGVNTGEVAGRIGLVFDTRDDEVTTSKGVFAQAIASFADASFLGDVTYARLTISAAGFLPVGSRLVLAARVVGQGQNNSSGLGSYYLVESSDRFFQAVGGGLSHRAVPNHRYLGTDKLFGNLDVRYHALDMKGIAEATVLAFLDAGRVFQDESFRLTFDDMHVGGGVGLIITLFRTGVVGWTIGTGPDGVWTNVMTRVTY